MLGRACELTDLTDRQGGGDGELTGGRARTRERGKFRCYRVRWKNHFRRPLLKANAAVKIKRKARE